MTDPSPPTAVGEQLEDDAAFVARLEAARAQHRAGLAANLDRHCGRSSCGCRHDECDRGWHDADDPFAGTRPCATCRPGLYDAVTLAVNDDDRRRRLAQHRAEPDAVPGAPGWT